MSRLVPSRLVIGGDQPFVRRLIGVSTSPMVGSIYNIGVWDKVAAAWVNVATRRTLAREKAARRRYKETGRSLENGGCIGDPHIVVDRCMVVLCILHYCMAIGRLQVAFIETRLADLPKENTDAVLRALYRAHTGVQLGATGAPDGEEARALFLAWEELGPLLDYVPEDGEWQAVVAMRDLLRQLYTDKPPRVDLRAAEVARAYRAHCCKEACQSNYLLSLEEDVTEAVANAGLGQAVAQWQGCGLRGGLGRCPGPAPPHLRPGVPALVRGLGPSVPCGQGGRGGRERGQTGGPGGPNGQRGSPRGPCGGPQCRLSLPGGQWGSASRRNEREF